MAWWIHILFFNRYFRNNNSGLPSEGPFFAKFYRAFRQYIYDNLVDVLYFILGIFTYLYLSVSIATFFFEKYVPRAFHDLIDVLSEPYLGSLGIYVIVKEIERRRGRLGRKRFGELFAAIWLVFLVASTVLVYFSPEYQASDVYKTTVTNALAALIIRIGTLIR